MQPKSSTQTPGIYANAIMRIRIVHASNANDMQSLNMQQKKPNAISHAIQCSVLVS